MINCCEDKSCEITALRDKHSRVLMIVLAINAAMFVIEGMAGILANSTSLMADALDMLGDALVYGFSLFVLARSLRWQASAALVKGGLMLAFGLGVLAEGIYKVFHPTMPTVETMGHSRRDCARCQCDVLLHAVPPSRGQPEHEFDLALFS